MREQCGSGAGQTECVRAREYEATPSKQDELKSWGISCCEPVILAFTVSKTFYVKRRFF